MKQLAKIILFTLVCSMPLGLAHAYDIFPQSSLTPSTEYYTNDLGSIAVMTGGGNAANVGLPSGRNDDGFMGPIDLGFTLDFYGGSYTSFYANNNGNISFNSGISSYIPSGPLGSNQPIISPFFADVDTRTSAGVMHVQNTVADQWVITWDQVGFYSQNATPTNSFQLILRGPDFDVPAGEGTFGFFYRAMGWDVTDTSTTAAVGFGNGSGDGIVIQGSNQPGMAAVLQNHNIWFTQVGDEIEEIGPIPEPSTFILLSGGLVGLAFAVRRRNKE